MKTKKVTKTRKALRAITVEDELKSELGEVYSDDFLDEEAMAMVGDDDSYYF